MSNLTFRYPDDPARMPADQLPRLERMSPGLWWGFTKGDGWRRPAYCEGSGVWTFHSKRGDGIEARKSPPKGLVELFSAMDWPEGIAIDMEWMGPRLREHFPTEDDHEFWIFDMTYCAWKWQGKTPFAKRWVHLSEIFHDAARGKPENFPRVRLLAPYKENLAQAFEQEQANPLSEGLVLRHVRGHLVGDLNGPRKNPGAMKKVKYRNAKEKTAF